MFTKFSCISTPDLSKHVFFNTEDIIILSIDLNLWPLTCWPLLIQWYLHTLDSNMGVPGDSMVENPPANSGDVSVIPGLGRSPGEGNGNPL